MRSSRIILLSGVLAFAGLNSRGQELADSISAVVNEVPITQQQILIFVAPQEEHLAQQYATQPETFRKKALAVRETAAEYLINRAVILHDFKTSIKVPDAIIDEFVTEELNRQIKEKFHGEAEFIKQLQHDGMTKEEYRQKVREEFIIGQMRLKFVPEPIISPRKVEDYYLAHRDDFKVEDQIKMRMIVINKNDDTTDKTRKRAEEIYSQIKGGASFADLARSYSDGSTMQEGGETGWEDVSIVNKTLVDELNKLKPGQYSGVIEMPQSYYILLLEDRHTAHFKPLNEVREQIEGTLMGLETDRLQKQWIDRLRTKTFVNMNF